MSMYHRDRIEGLPPTDDHSRRYWRAQARRVFAARPDIHTIEVVLSGRKTDSQYVGRGIQYAPAGICVIVASTGGRWGKSRRQYLPQD